MSTPHPNSYVHRPRKGLARFEIGTVAELLRMEHRQPFVAAPGAHFESGSLTTDEIKTRCVGKDSEIAAKDALHPSDARLFDEDEARRQIRRDARRNKAFEAETEHLLVAITARHEWDSLLKPLTPPPAPVVYIHPDTP